jgi:hypothetical protein
MANTLRDSETGKLYEVSDREARTDDASPVSPKADYSMSVAARVVYFVGGVIISLLALRFLLMLFGANRGSVFVDFIYTASRPFVAPFFGIFNYTEQVGRSRFEFETLFAILIYALLTWAIARLLTLGKRDQTTSD